MKKQHKAYQQPALTEWHIAAADTFLFNPTSTNSLPSNPDTPGVGVKQEWDMGENIWEDDFTD